MLEIEGMSFSVVEDSDISISRSRDLLLMSIFLDDRRILFNRLSLLVLSPQPTVLSPSGNVTSSSSLLVEPVESTAPVCFTSTVLLMHEAWTGSLQRSLGLAGDGGSGDLDGSIPLSEGSRVSHVTCVEINGHYQVQQTPT